MLEWIQMERSVWPSIYSWQHKLTIKVKYKYISLKRKTIVNAIKSFENKAKNCLAVVEKI